MCSVDRGNASRWGGGGGGGVQGEEERDMPYVASDSDCSSITHFQKTTKHHNTHTQTLAVHVRSACSLTHITPSPLLGLFLSTVSSDSLVCKCIV